MQMIQKKMAASKKIPTENMQNIAVQQMAYPRMEFDELSVMCNSLLNGSLQGSYSDC
jgi:hypothetical protein